MNVSRLPDMHRRSPSYKVNVQELMIRDDLLTEQWYTLGNYLLVSQHNLAALEYICGTKYPVVLTGNETLKLLILLYNIGFCEHIRLCNYRTPELSDAST